LESMLTYLVQYTYNAPCNNPLKVGIKPHPTIKPIIINDIITNHNSLKTRQKVCFTINMI
jgi:hypothetical protein